ncbi:MAG: nucleotidyltransferase domain-containing protein [Chloroflexi bacterium]|nr:nucleotidyltransferase domain-containing protein [Chloroflexota bacterium]
MRGVNAFYRRVAEKFAQRLVEKVDGAIEAVILYGSVAKKRARRDSDIDLLVISQDPGLREHIFDISYDLDEEHNFDVFVSTFTVTPQQLSRGLSRGSPLMWRVMEEGIALYDQGTFQGLHQELLGSSPRSP